MKKQVILLSSHIFNDFIIAQYHKLLTSITDAMDLYLLIEFGKDDLIIPKDINYFSFNVNTLNELNYTPIEETIVPGSNHFQLFQFFRAFPQYEYYWNIEYDVYCNGEWCKLFDAYKFVDSDFISSHLQRYHQSPDWWWWKSLQLNTFDISKDQFIKSFNPIYRISNKAMVALDRVMSEENSGHHEVLMPTVLNYLGYKINDWGGIGEFVLDGYKNSVYATDSNVHFSNYIGSSMRYRPEFKLEELEHIPQDNLLYHPVKG